MAARVEEAVAEMTSDDFCLVHCFDNIAYMARSEEGGDLPIRKFTSGDYHIEGEFFFVKNINMGMKKTQNFLLISNPLMPAFRDAPFKS